MARTVTIDGFDAAVREILDEYEEMTVHTVREVTQKIAKEGVKLLKSESRGKFGGSGKYAKGWTTTSEGGRFDTTVTIHNNTPRLPHLLEHGHANRNGGRTSGRIHIGPVETKIIKDYERRLMVEL